MEATSFVNMSTSSFIAANSNYGNSFDADFGPIFPVK